MKYALILVLALCGSAMADDCATNWMDCTADSPVGITSFTQRATEVIGEITAARVEAARAVLAHKITTVQAKAVLSKTNRARTLWDQARTACQADRVGNCKADSTRAFTLLNSAQRVLQ